MHTMKPGESAPDSGIYEARKADGAPFWVDDDALGHPLRCTLTRGETAPATPAPGYTWVQVIDTNPHDAASRRDASGREG